MTGMAGPPLVRQRPESDVIDAGVAVGLVIVDLDARDTWPSQPQSWLMKAPRAYRSGPRSSSSFLWSISCVHSSI